MFTIIQRNSGGFWNVVDSTYNLNEARELAADHCNAAGVKRTLILDEMGECVGIES